MERYCAPGRNLAISNAHKQGVCMGYGRQRDFSGKAKKSVGAEEQKMRNGLYRDFIAEKGGERTCRPGGFGLVVTIYCRPHEMRGRPVLTWLQREAHFQAERRGGRLKPIQAEPSRGQREEHR